MISKLALVEYIYEPLESNRRFFLYKKSDSMTYTILDTWIGESSNYTIFTIEAALEPYKAFIEPYIDGVLVMQAMYYKQQLDANLQAVGISMSELVRQELEFKQNLESIVKNINKTDLKLIKA